MLFVLPKFPANMLNSQNSPIMLELCPIVPKC